MWPAGRILTGASAPRYIARMSTTESVARPTAKGPVAVILPGGGARAAYQVGVLKSIAEMTGGAANPFPVICGVSAGAINATVLASHAHEFATGVERLEHYWANMYCARIYRTDAWSVFRSVFQWAFSLPLGGTWIRHPRSLLDNRPLKAFLESVLNLDGIEQAIECGALEGVAITASGYTSESAITFYQASANVMPWSLESRRGEPARLSVEHLLASAALPLIFPAQLVGAEFFGDGGMRMMTPLSPAIHLGAERLLVIGTRDQQAVQTPAAPGPYPSLGEIGGYLLDTIFMDTTIADLKRLERINRTLALIPPERRSDTSLKHLDTLVIQPSCDMGELTRRHVHKFPQAVRLLLHSLGGWGRDWRLASYLLFEQSYCTELMALGYQDGMAMSEQLRDFLNLS